MSDDKITKEELLEETSDEEIVVAEKLEESEEVSKEPEQLEEPQKVKKPFYKNKLCWGIAGMLGVLLVIYLGFSFYFMEHFQYNTVINGIDVSKMTVKEVEAEIQKQIENYELTLNRREDKTEIIKGTDIELQYAEDGIIEETLKNQNAFLWFVSLWEKSNTKIKVNVGYNEEKLSQAIDSLECVDEEQQMLPVSAKPVYENGKFVIQDEVLGTQINRDVFDEVVASYVLKMAQSLDLGEENCYTEPARKKDSEEVLAAQEKLNESLKASITYDFKIATVTVDKEEFAEWLKVDDDLQISLDKSAVKQYVKNLAKEYDTVGKVKTFKTPTGKSAQVSGGSYGWKISQSKECDKLIENILNGDVVTRAPVYSQKAVSRGATEWGSTYIEVDLSAQHMWYIEGGDVVFETDVVTGSPGRSTPQGIYEILEKMRNKTLLGNIMPNGEREYETPVDYWARVTWSGIGFHDATWQPAFGGNLYKEGYGSHGCINMPLDAVASFYKMIKVGCPVIIHY